MLFLRTWVSTCCAPEPQSTPPASQLLLKVTPSTSHCPSPFQIVPAYPQLCSQTAKSRGSYMSSFSWSESEDQRGQQVPTITLVPPGTDSAILLYEEGKVVIPPGTPKRSFLKASYY